MSEFVAASRAGAYPADMSPRPLFVLHEHDRPRHHFDLRLEEAGVLRSWAVPKGLPTDSAHDRLAVLVDDHELDHATYEDDSKRIADSGWWELESRNDRRTILVLHGREGARRYALIDTGGQALLHLTRTQPLS
jgi:hypothetical protein